jgi:uncharacterized protein
MARSTSLADEQYISLETFKKDGTGVKTPVWCTPLDGGIAIFSEAKAFKVKRINNDPRCRVAACDARGKVLGPFVDGTARIVDDARWIERALDSFRDKYGIQFRVVDFFAGISGRKRKRAYIEVKLAGEPS